MPVHNPSILVNGRGGQILIQDGIYEEPGGHDEGILFNHGTVPDELLEAHNARPSIVPVTGSSVNVFGHTLFWIDQPSDSCMTRRREER